MTRLVKPLVATTVALGCAAGAVVALQPPTPPAVAKVADKPAVEKPSAGKSGPADMKHAVEPKPLTEQVKKGFTYLAKSQQADGGWSQGGGWRTATGDKGGRVEGKDVEDPSDVGNTCIALLAFVRAGNSPSEGEYKDNVKKGLSFVFDQIEKADADSLSVTDVKSTQLQSKIGPYVDTFLANLVLAEMKGKAGEQEKRLTACLDKTIHKVTKNQQKDGLYAGNGGWAPVLSQALANKGLSRSRQFGAEVSNEALARAGEQSQRDLKMATTAGAAKGGIAGGIAGGLGGLGGPGPGVSRAEWSAERLPAGAATLTGDAGVPLYSLAQQAGNSQDVVNSIVNYADKARSLAGDPKANVMVRGIARQQVARHKRISEENFKGQAGLRQQIQNPAFVAGFGSNGGEEFLSFLNISEALLIAGGPDWEKWDKKMTDGLVRAQDKEGSWAGQHCITGKTFCTAGALLVLTADRTQFPAAAIEQAKKDAAAAKAAADKKPEKKDEKK